MIFIKVLVLLVVFLAVAYAQEYPLTTYNCAEEDRTYFYYPIQWVCRSNCVSTPNLAPSVYMDWCSNEGCLLWAYMNWMAVGQCTGFGHI